MRHGTPARILAAALLALASDRAAGGMCASQVNNPPALACAANALSLADSVLNPPVGEDLSFFTSTSAVPTVVFLLDTSANMRALPLDVTSAGVRSAGVRCSNAILNRLKYKANPCRNGWGGIIPTANLTTVAQTSCTGGLKPGYPKGWNAVYNPGNAYPPFEAERAWAPENADLFNGSKFYVLDWGWAPDTRTVQGGFAYATTGNACAAAGLAPGSPDHASCQACLTGAASPLDPTVGGGYWLHPTDPSIAVFSGHWLNFYPPKYVLARRIVREQIQAMDAAGASRQALAVLATDLDPAQTVGPGSGGTAIRFGCYGPTDKPSNPDHYAPLHNGTGQIDPLRDGARFLDASSTLEPACSAGSCTPSGSVSRAGLATTLEGSGWLFSSPAGAGANLVDGTASGDVTGCPAVPGVRWRTGPDGICRGTYDSALPVVKGGATIPSPFPATLNGGRAVCAPYGEALFNVGQYFSSSGLYATLFPTSPSGGWLKSAAGVYGFDEGSGVNASVCAPNTCGCPQPAVIMITGGSPQFDDNLPAALTGAPACGVGGSSSNVVKVAQALATTNLRTEAFSSPVTLQTFVVDLGGSDATLAAAARAGKGAYVPAQDAKGLRSALNEFLLNIRTRPTSFSNTAVSAVQSVSTQGVLVPRFKPQPGPLWEGHLYKYKLFSEAACGCPAVAGCDLNADGACDGVYFQDADGSVVVETAQGEFQKAKLVGAQFEANGTPATPTWDAGQRLGARTADSRKIMTVLDSNGDGVVDHRDQVIEFSRANACALAPYLNLAGSAICDMLNAQYNACLPIDECVGVVIDFVRGKDVLNTTCTAGFDRANPPDRPNKLGDIFHSSPAVVNPPLRAGSPIGELGLENQYLLALEATATVQATDASGATAYASYARANGRRDKTVLVGANDGMLHAFHNGRWRGADNPATPFDECPSASTCTGYYDDGTGEELWAFIPPDMLPKLQNLMMGSHEYYVDGTAMVRDVWSDDGPSPNYQKDASEFHTVAVVGERRGGTAFFALDVTDPAGPATLPSAGFFRWMYPQPTSTDLGRTASTYSDFLPTPPPIGPVRLANAASPYLYAGKHFEERWVALLNGGYDMTMQGRGNGLVMLDVWRGGGGNAATASKPLWSVWGNSGAVTYTVGATSFTGAGVMAHSIAATPGLIAFGPGTTRPPNEPPNGYFFDTATVVDVGGQMWTVRYNDPDPTKWAVARAFTVSDTGSAPGSINVCARQPFFHVTSNVVSVADGNHLRTSFGSGDRFNLRDTTYGGTCSPTDLVACARRGCSVAIEFEQEACGGEKEVQPRLIGTNASTCALIPGNVENEAGWNLASCCTSEIEIEQEVRIQCPGSVQLHFEPEVECKRSSAPFGWCGDSLTPFVCDTHKDIPFDFASSLPATYASPLSPPPPRNGFYSMRVFDRDVPARAVFNDRTATTAGVFDGAHLTSGGLTLVDPYSPGTAPAGKAGWRIEYGLPNPPGHVLGAGYDALNERTGTLSTVLSGCTIWSTLTPSSNVASCSAVPDATSSTYQIDLVTGTQCSNGSTFLASVRDSRSAVPPAPPQSAYFITPSGGVEKGPLVPPGRDRPRFQAVDSSSELLRQIQWLEVPRALHACRHAPDRAKAQVFCPTN